MTSLREDRYVPSSTYRIQLSSAFTLNDLARHVPYFAALGIGDLYLSPVHEARPGSTHGYDAVDHGCIDSKLGGCEAWHRLCQLLSGHGIGVVLDIVPNHMAADPVHNRLWRRVLKEGPSSPVARYFDVDWRPLTGLIRDTVVLPLLEEPYGEALLRGRVAVISSEGELLVQYGAMHLPVADGSVPSGQSLDQINQDPQQLHEILERQHYRLAYWRPANDEINYRRFFDINELISIRAEDEEVFEQSHRLVLQLTGQGVVRGLRVDHVDGLLEPSHYLQRLRSATDRTSRRPVWIVVEKILDRSETIDPEWPIEGTTGYDALNMLNRLFISGRGVRILRRFYERLVDDWTTFDEVAYRSKRLIMEGRLRSGLTILSHALKRVADSSWTTRDVSLNSLSEALIEFIASLTVYRTYLGNGRERPADRKAIEQALDRAARRNPSMDATVFHFLQSLFFEDRTREPRLAHARDAAVKRLQQYMSGVQAKGVEDTAYYRDNTLLALNEVGGDPGGSSVRLQEFHRFNAFRARYWPHTQNATSTHDTKLGEDARIRIGALSVVAGEWSSAVRSWIVANAPFRRNTREGPAPSRNDEYRLYQTLVGVWPADGETGGSLDGSICDRVTAYMKKSAREAHVHSSWMRPNPEYEAAFEAFIRDLFTHERADAFRCAMSSLVQTILPLSFCHSISQLVLKCLIPGVPDVYQGTELWALSLTDPDNRRPIDLNAPATRLSELMHHNAPPWIGPTPSARCDDVKLYATLRLLRFRRDHAEWMARATYRPLRVRGRGTSAVVAFARSWQSKHIVVVVPRLIERPVVERGWPAGEPFWADTQVRIPSSADSWIDLWSGERVSTRAASWLPLSEMSEPAGRTHPWPWIVLTTC